LRILGIDPGTAIVGFGVIDVDGSRCIQKEYGCIRTSSQDPTPLRLRQIYENMKELIDRCKPQCVAVEELFFNKNVKTALAVGQARGVIFLAAVEKGLPVFEYTPLQVKQAVVGYGRAEKDQIQEMVRVLLRLESRPSPDDAADALAVAICHAHSRKLNDIFRQHGE
jgi:crossover junction endodeoxyribonuclease RuvC